MKTLRFAAALLLLASSRAGAQAPPDYDSTYDALSRTFPDEACPPWQVTDTAVPEMPNVVPAGLMLETSSNAENMFYAQVGSLLQIGDPLVVEFRTRWLSGSSSSVARATVGVGVAIGADRGTILYIGNHDVFLLAGAGVRGAAASVDTASAHTYRLEVRGSGLVEVFYDDAYLLAGSTYLSTSDFGAVPRIFWGDVTSSAFGRSEWTLMRHNAHATGCPDVDQDGDGALFEEDCDDEDPSAHPGAAEVFDGVDNDCNSLVDENLDADADGVPDFADMCADTPAGGGVDPEGCPACALDPDADGDGVPASADCDDADAAVYPGATETCNGTDDDCNGTFDEGFDGDADGFTSCASPTPDCNDADPAVNADAVDLPGNPVDENCDGAATCDPGASWSNHGSFMNCVMNEVMRLLAAGDITREQAEQLLRNAAGSNAGKKEKNKDDESSDDKKNDKKK